MYSLSSIKAAVRQPRLAAAEINELCRRGFGVRSSPVSNEAGVDVLSADWDNLIILDACRFDVFEQVASDLPGTLEKAESKASATVQFLRATFSNEELHDSVYVTANPQLYRVENGIHDAEPIDVSFHDQIDVWQDHWHDDYRTVMPGVVTDAALQAAQAYPNKRLLVHYLQPHAPYVGPTGRNELPTDYLDFWRSFRQGEFDVSLETARRAYRENCELVVPHVGELLSQFDGRTVVTADHGELLGERDFPIPVRRFGHPTYTNLPAVVEVPWLVHQSDPRPEIVAERPEKTEAGESSGSDVVESRLRDLGYVD
jgi:hypothetical protein